MMDLYSIEAELKKRLIYSYMWGTKQNDKMDKATRFIYYSKSFEELLSEIEKKFSGSDDYRLFKNYSLNRWFSFRSAKAVEWIFCSHDNVRPAADQFNKHFDFEIDGIRFDHKTTVCPQTNYPIDSLIKEKRKIILWLYKNQSKQGRLHFKNRLFILLYDANGEHWKLRSEILWLKEIIYNYMQNFNSGRLEKFILNGEVLYSDIIWAVKR